MEISQLNKLLQSSKNTASILEKEQKSTKRDYSDPNMFVMSKAADGTNTVRLRFLPNILHPEKSPFVTYSEYSILYKNRWFIARNPYSHEPPLPDPVFDFNKKIKDNIIQCPVGWNVDKYAVRRYVGLVYVIDDEVNPKNNGKVFKLKFGKQVFGLIDSMSSPSIKGMKSRNVFDLEEGYDFFLHVYQKGEFPSYERSVWANEQTPLADTKEKMMEILEMASKIDLDDEVSDDKWESYERLSNRLEYVITGERQNYSNTNSSESVKSEESKTTHKSTSGEVKHNFKPEIDPDSSFDDNMPDFDDVPPSFDEDESPMGTREESSSDILDSDIDDILDDEDFLK